MFGVFPLEAMVYLAPSRVVAVAQSVRALDCGSRGCGFDSRQPPWWIADWRLRIADWARPLYQSAIRNPQSAIDFRSVAQLVEHRSPKPGVAGSIPAGPVENVKSRSEVCPCEASCV